MARGYGAEPSVSLPKPGPALRGVLLTLFAVWLAFAIGLNWAGAPDSLFLALCGNTSAILHGQVWRLFTAPLMHEVRHDIGHVLWVLLGLYFFGASLESHLGSGRFLRFLGLSAILSYVVQMAVELALPPLLAARLVPEYWFGSVPLLSALSVAWALSFKHRTINLMFVVPVTSRALIIIVLFFNLMYLIAGAGRPEGQIAPFGGMLAGWLLSGSPSPFRRVWLKLRLAQLDAEARREADARKKRVARGGFKVIEGGKSEAAEDGSPDGDGRKGPNGGWLN
ncbi:MAG TPA: rhomboid family intramembrane serine protease [Polyangiaceae bacterium]|nr:rhomboid family intramembrane serine protease [Polyangiaceae bacterium]